MSRQNEIIRHQIDHSDRIKALYLKTLGSYFFIILGMIYVNYEFSKYAGYITKVVLVIWLANIYFYYKNPFMRLEAFKLSKNFSGGYVLILIALQLLIKYFWGLQINDISNSLDPTVVKATGTISMSVVNMLLSLFFIASVSIPLSYFIMMQTKSRHYDMSHEKKVLKRFRKEE